MFYAERDIEVLYNLLFQQTIYFRLWISVNVYDCTYMRKLSVTVIVLTIWFKNSSFFSLFITSFWTISWNSYIFHFFCRNDLNACDLPGPMSEVHCGGSSWLAPLNFMVHAPVRTIFNPRHELHSSKRVNHMHSEHYDKKWIT